jgi:hypothetical protein
MIMYSLYYFKEAMMDKSRYIFGNKISNKVYKKAEKAKRKYIKKFGDDSNIVYKLGVEENKTLGTFLGIKNIVAKDINEEIDIDKGIIIGNIRMGYGHYRIAIAIASAAKSMGYTPYWFSLNSFTETTGGKIIEYLNKLYSLGSKLSQKFSLFNKIFWETLNRGEYRRLPCNAVDQKITELMTPVYRELSKDIPFIATHVWPAQAAVHAGVKRVINVIPDNYPVAFNLAEGSIHAVQTPSAFMGYKMLIGMETSGILKPIPDNDLFDVGHYIDHEIVSNLEADCLKRINRIKSKAAKRILLTIGGAGAQEEIYSKIIKEVMPFIKDNKAVLFINVGDHKNVWDRLCFEIPELCPGSEIYFNEWERTCKFAEFALENAVSGIHVFFNEDIFAAVYTTNLFIRSADVVITKPSELAFYPVPKLLIKRIGGHEAWGAIRAAEIGDGTIEFDNVDRAFQMLRLMLEKDEILTMLCNKILKANKIGIYDGAYRVVQLAVDKRRGEE